MAGKYLAPRTDTPGGCPKGGDSIRDKRRKIITISLAVLFFLLALGLTIYPIFSSRYNEAHQSQIHTEYQDTVQALPDTAIPEARAAAQAYNEDLWSSIVQYGSLAATEQPGVLFSVSGQAGDVFGVLSIPKLELEMPLYLGATDRHMADGAAQLGQTSIPIGGENTNAVIAGHRGYNGAPYFRYVPELQIGDSVDITNLWGTLHYKVVETRIIQPNDIDAIKIQPGRDLITLLTCHPYASGGRQRFLVICERTEDR